MEPVASGLTYDDLAALPDDGMRHELIHGEHFVTPAPILPHQAVVGRLHAELLRWCDDHGGLAFVSPTDVYLADDTVLCPDVLGIRADRVGLLRDLRYVEVPPDLAVEVSSPSTRSYDLVRKRRAYEEFGVAEFWFVDLDARRVEVYRLGTDGTYGQPLLVEHGAVACAAMGRFAVDLELLFSWP